jgi:Domain of unknown function (DUF4105)
MPFGLGKRKTASTGRHDSVRIRSRCRFSASGVERVRYESRNGMRACCVRWFAARRLGAGLVFAAAWLCGSSDALAESGAASGALLTRARTLGVAESIAWLRLLHYRPDAERRSVSQIDGKTFFLAPNGARDPAAELEATLRAFSLPLEAGREDEHALCRFPARRRMLDERLHFTGALHTPTCPALARYLAVLDPESVAAVYAANYLNNPASAFGHTFLRLRKRRPKGSAVPDDALAFGVEYVANTDTENPFLYAFKGLTGLFPGVFRFHSYESKLHEYANGEARDLWEYELDLTHAEVTMLALHLWELSTTHLDYYYLTKNCSYHLLATLEAAAPRIDLVSRLNFVVLPRDTIKALYRIPGLVRGTVYRPSVRSQSLPNVVRREAAQKAPQRAHGSMRLTLGSGITSQYGSSFDTFGYRLALHDLNDPPGGEMELLQVQFLDTQFRYDLGERSFTLNRLTFAELVALNPLTRDETALSWRGRAFGMRLHDRGCSDCFAHGLEVGLGATLASDDEHLALFVMADAYVAFSPSLAGIHDSFVRVGVGPYAGLRARLAFHTLALVTANWSYLPAQSLLGTYDVRATLRSALTNDVAVGFEAALQPSSSEAQLASYFYF